MIIAVTVGAVVVVVVIVEVPTEIAIGANVLAVVVGDMKVATTTEVEAAGVVITTTAC